MDANYTADPRFQAWSAAAHRSFAGALDAALQCARLDEMETRAVMTGAAYALAEAILRHEGEAGTLEERVARAADVWATMGASVFVQLAAGLTAPRPS